jgi:hypothetical protein
MRCSLKVTGCVTVVVVRVERDCRAGDDRHSRIIGGRIRPVTDRRFDPTPPRLGAAGTS